MIALILALAVTTAAFAQGRGPAALQPNAGQCLNYVDADGDGVCDNAGTGMNGQPNSNVVDADRNGVCDNLGQQTPSRDGTGNQNAQRGRGRW